MSGGLPAPRTLTICALSSGSLPSGVAVVRISGPDARHAAQALCGRVPSTRTAELVTIRDRNNLPLDRGLALYFPGPNSFTGENVLELQIHGGRAVVGAVLTAATSIPQVRLAEPGEFTLRAFLNGKIDLTQAEALADLIAAETETQRRAAMRNAEGGQRLLYEGWRVQLIRARAMIEAEIDFADEPETEAAAAHMNDAVTKLAGAIRDHLDGSHRAEIVREGFRVAIVGAPNAGKSSLLNALARRDVAIVADEPGTTRDVLEVALDLGGQKVVLMDTAGIREDAGRVEQLGIGRAIVAAKDADLVLEAVDIGENVRVERHVLGDADAITIGTKEDLHPGRGTGFDLAVSAVTGAGLSALLDRLEHEAKQRLTGEDILPARLRHQERLQECLRHLERLERLQVGDLELAAEELRLASGALGAITGVTSTEHLLDVIFGEFCLGK